MGFNLSHIGDDLKETVIEFDGEELHITYHFDRYTAEFEERLRAYGESEYQAQGVLELFTLLVAKWDAVDDDEGTYTGTPNAPIELSVEGLKKIPLAFLGDVLEAIGREAVPDESQGKTSGATS